MGYDILCSKVMENNFEMSVGTMKYLQNNVTFALLPTWHRPLLHWCLQ